MNRPPSAYVVDRLADAKRERRAYFSEYDRIKREAIRAEKRAFAKPKVVDIHRATLNAKPKRVTAETAHGVEWAHSNKRPGTMVTGHGFSWRYCSACDDVRLWHVSRGCSSAHRHDT